MFKSPGVNIIEDKYGDDRYEKPIVDACIYVARGGFFGFFC